MHNRPLAHPIEPDNADSELPPHHPPPCREEGGEGWGGRLSRRGDGGEGWQLGAQRSSPLGGDGGGHQVDFVEKKHHQLATLQAEKRSEGGSEDCAQLSVIMVIAHRGWLIARVDGWLIAITRGGVNPEWRLKTNHPTEMAPHRKPLLKHSQLATTPRRADLNPSVA